MSTRRWAFVLATSATSTALCLSLLSGWQRGGSLAERLVWIAIGLVLVTSAHLLPALLRDAPLPVRATGSVLWGACLATACFGHAVFFVTAQQHAGELRILAVPAALVPTSGRSLTTVMAEGAAATAQLATANARYCVGNCGTLEARRVTLGARIDALNAEADDIRRQQAADDRVTARRDALLVDPVTSRLSALLGTTTARVDLLSGLMFAAVLEGVACLLWTLALRPPSSMAEPAATGVIPAVLPAVITPGTASHAEGTVSRESSTASRGDTTRNPVRRTDRSSPALASDPIDDHLTELVRDIATGLVRPTVADIRRHLGCSQATALALRRLLAQSASATAPNEPASAAR